jgi:hypothetical protein
MKIILEKIYPNFECQPDVKYKISDQPSIFMAT